MIPARIESMTLAVRACDGSHRNFPSRGTEKCECMSLLGLKNVMRGICRNLVWDESIALALCDLEGR